MKKSKNSGIERYKEKLLSIIVEVLPECKVYLFGSRARRDYDTGADIDLALDMGKEIAREKIYLIKEKMEETTIPLTVDIVDLYSASEQLQKDVKKEGILWKN